MTPKVYIDGHVGTTGLRIRDWLAKRSDLQLITVPESERKSSEARRELMHAADLTVLCLLRTRRAGEWARTAPGKVIDASTAHRVAEGWVYGLPELAGAQRDGIRNARHVTNPGCYASAFVLLVRPLIDNGCLVGSAPLAIHALSGYSGGGRALIEKWEQGGLLSLPYEAPYALAAVHKHIPEMRLYGGLAAEPQFIPAVGAFRCGMRVEVPLHASAIAGGGAREIRNVLRSRYEAEPFVRVMPLEDAASVDEHTLDPRACNDTNRIDLYVLGHPSGHVLLVAILDNLGKGAAGVAIQNLNLMLGLDEGSLTAEMCDLAVPAERLIRYIMV
jgi:N-acetyl-gamma-glutamyl-phosphate reductase